MFILTVSAYVGHAPLVGRLGGLDRMKEEWRIFIFMMTMRSADEILARSEDDGPLGRGTTCRRINFGFHTNHKTI